MREHFLHSTLINPDVHKRGTRTTTNAWCPSPCRSQSWLCESLSRNMHHNKCMMSFSLPKLELIVWIIVKEHAQQQMHDVLLPAKARADCVNHCLIVTVYLNQAFFPLLPSDLACQVYLATAPELQSPSSHSFYPMSAGSPKLCHRPQLHWSKDV